MDARYVWCSFVLWDPTGAVLMSRRAHVLWACDVNVLRPESLFHERLRALRPEC